VRIVRFIQDGTPGLALQTEGGLRGLPIEPDFPGLDELIDAGAAALAGAEARLKTAPLIDEAAITYAPPLVRPRKIICVGLNYAEHTSESPYEQPDRPTLFARFATTLVGHGQPIVRPLCSESLDYEGEMVAIIGVGGRHIPAVRALDHVVGYSVFNEGSVREYQFNSPQWTLGKNFDATGGFGPAFVSADEAPPGGRGLKIVTRLNGVVVQSANTDEMIFSVAEIIAAASEAVTLQPGDVLVTGTPSGIGWGKEPKLFMRHGDRCEVELEGIGLLSNPIVDETPAA
jgi:2-keto-4-pentenoate hydratase/2-oxohepta-3-ene-1,7-dioic acid hydratase in catechol pathway